MSFLLKLFSLSFCCFFIATVSLSGQNQSGDFPPLSHYEKGKLRFKSTQFLEVKNITFEEDSLSFIHPVSHTREKAAYTQIESLRVIKGTKVISGAAWGTTLTLLFILEPIIDNKPNVPNAGLIVAKVLGGSALLGAFVGINIPAWKTYSLSGKKNMNFSFSYGLNIDPENYGFRVAFHF